MPRVSNSRISARRRNDVTYRGLLCSGHGRERYTRNGKCVICCDAQIRKATQLICRRAYNRVAQTRRNAQPGTFTRQDIVSL